MVGFNLRLSGQDVERGTFSQRHFVFTDQDTGTRHVPFCAFGPGQLQVHNSHLSEFGVVGFEYGVSIADPAQTLTIWEAQFGDFFNGAQVVFDAFVSSGETKWGLESGLTILLPHGYDGAGPDHSSCRLERFLQMSNAPFDIRKEPESRFINWHVAYPTTPANYFHLLRRQIKRSYRKPLIVASPKKLFRLPAAVSSFGEFTEGSQFQPILDDARSPEKVKRVVFCSGKFYYEIEKERVTRKANDMAIIRIEELCPLPSSEIQQVLKRYTKAKTFIWCQEEHQNMGAYSYIAPRLGSLLPSGVHLSYIGRGVAAAPAAGFPKLHSSELAQLLSDLFV